ncbi:hypothetical protein C348_04796 [Cryptococcus neoformans Gb118]|nr:hypothetical protein C350_04551 [Cryptococcus neoformans var. grubii MW-RSA36]OXL07000.1 hypothetical protein C348_04796 [Cryptococcus neoformans var. grubii Gb118]
MVWIWPLAGSVYGQGGRLAVHEVDGGDGACLGSDKTPGDNDESKRKTPLISHPLSTLFDSHTFHLIPIVAMLRLTNIARTTIRQLSTTAIRREEAAAVGTVGAVPVKRRVGGFRGGILGFFFGFAFASSLSIYYLQQETKLATGLLTASIEELQQGTGNITSHLDRLQTVEKELATLKANNALKEDVTKVRGEMKKVYDGLHLELLDLRAHVWGVEQDLQKVVKTESIKI